MHLSTQIPLRQIKVTAMETLNRLEKTHKKQSRKKKEEDLNDNGEDERMPDRLALFQTCFFVKQQQVFIRVTMVNHLPKSGHWQVMRKLPVENKLIAVVFEINISNVSDRGSLVISTEEPDANTIVLSEEEKKTFYGVYDATNKSLLRYCDTTPTW